MVYLALRSCSLGAMFIIACCNAKVLEIWPRAGLMAQIVSQGLHLRLRASNPQDHITVSPSALLAHRVILKASLEDVQGKYSATIGSQYVYSQAGYIVGEDQILTGRSRNIQRHSC